MQNVIASYSGLCETVRLRVREQDLEEAKMFTTSSLKKGLSEKVARVLGLRELPVTILKCRSPRALSRVVPPQFCYSFQITLPL